MQRYATSTPARPIATLSVLLTAPVLAQLDATIANVASPDIRQTLGASGTVAELVIGGYMISFAVLLTTGARLGQAFGYRRMFLAGLTIFASASLVDGTAPSSACLIAARVVQGVGAAVMLPQALTGIRRSFDGPARARAIGWYASALSTGAVVGQLAGGALISANIAGLGWRTIFLINLPVCAAVMLAARRYLPVDHGQDRVGVDVAGSALLSTCILLVVLPLTLGRGQGWPTWTWLSLAAAVPVFVLFLRRQHTSGDAGRPVIINLAAVGRPEVRFGLLANAFATSTYYALLFMVADYEQRGLGNTGLRSSLVLLPWVAAFGLAGQITRRVPAKLARHLPVAGGVLLASTYLVITVSLWTGRSGDGVLALVFAAGGLGLGMQFTTLLANMMNAAPARFAPDVSGAASTIAQVAGVVGIAAFGSLYLGLDGSGGSAAHASRALAVTAIVLTASSAVGAAVAHRAMRPVRPDRSETEPTSSGDEQSGPRMSRVSLDHVAVPAQRRRVAGQ